MRQQKIQILRAVTIPAILSRRVKLNSPLFIHLSGPKFIPLRYDLLAERLASELTSDKSNHTP
jgi:hypothetical protein